MNINPEIVKAVIFISIIGSPIAAIIIAFNILKNDCWTSTQKILTEINKDDFEIFENVQLQISTSSRFRLTTGISHRGTLYLNDSRLIIVGNNKPTFLTYNTVLPLDVLKINLKNNFEIKICNWKAVILTSGSKDSSILSIKREVLIEPKDNDDFERLKKIMNNWC